MKKSEFEKRAFGAYDYAEVARLAEEAGAKWDPDGVPAKRGNPLLADTELVDRMIVTSNVDRAYQYDRPRRTWYGTTVSSHCPWSGTTADLLCKEHPTIRYVPELEE